MWSRHQALKRFEVPSAKRATQTRMRKRLRNDHPTAAAASNGGGVGEPPTVWLKVKLLPPESG